MKNIIRYQNYKSNIVNFKFHLLFAATKHLKHAVHVCHLVKSPNLSAASHQIHYNPKVNSGQFLKKWNNFSRVAVVGRRYCMLFLLDLGQEIIEIVGLESLCQYIYFSSDWPSVVKVIEVLSWNHGSQWPGKSIHCELCLQFSLQVPWTAFSTGVLGMGMLGFT